MRALAALLLFGCAGPASAWTWEATVSPSDACIDMTVTLTKDELRSAPELSLRFKADDVIAREPKASPNKLPLTAARTSFRVQLIKTPASSAPLWHDGLERDLPAWLQSADTAVLFGLIPRLVTKSGRTAPKSATLRVPDGTVVVSAAVTTTVRGGAPVKLDPDSDGPLVLARSVHVFAAQGLPTAVVRSSNGLEARLSAFEILTALEQTFATPLPFPVTLVEAPLPRETYGLTTRGLMLLSTEVVDGIPAERAQLALAHELAHQFFGGLVKASFAVNETHATFAAFVALERTLGADRAKALLRQYEETVGARQDLSALRRLNAQRQLLGDAAFFRGMALYLSAFSGKAACDRCLTEALSKVAPDKAGGLLALEGEHPPADGGPRSP